MGIHMCVAVKRWKWVVPEKETVAPLSLATESTMECAAYRGREFPTTGVQEKISDNIGMLHRKRFTHQSENQWFYETEPHSVVWRDDPSSGKDRGPGFQSREPPGKRKTQIMQRAPNKRSGQSLSKWSQTGSTQRCKKQTCPILPPPCSVYG